MLPRGLFLNKRENRLFFNPDDLRLLPSLVRRPSLARLPHLPPPLRLSLLALWRSTPPKNYPSAPSPSSPLRH